MAKTKRKGDLGEAIITADAMRKGYQVAIPIGEDWRYDLIVLRKGKLERVQCKYVESDGRVINVPCRSCNTHQVYKYTSDDLDWIAVYDATTDQVYYIPGSFLGEGRATISLRITSSVNLQKRKVHLASYFTGW